MRRLPLHSCSSLRPTEATELRLPAVTCQFHSPHRLATTAFQAQNPQLAIFSLLLDKVGGVGKVGGVASLLDKVGGVSEVGGVGVGRVGEVGGVPHLQRMTKPAAEVAAGRPVALQLMNVLVSGQGRHHNAVGRRGSPSACRSPDALLGQHARDKRRFRPSTRLRRGPWSDTSPRCQAMLTPSTLSDARLSPSL